MDKARTAVVDGAAVRWFPEGAPSPPPVPFDIFLFKVASRCNLACPYCYIYELRDQSWREQPALMDEATFERALTRIREHVVAHSRRIITVIFHGGEPLLLGHTRLAHFAKRAHERLDDVTELRLGIQTNGVLLDERFIKVAREHKIRLGLSVDGPPRQHDKNRFDHEGKGTSALVERAAKLLSANSDVFGGILCVVDLETDPAEIFEYLSSLGSTSVDLILPHATHAHLPPGVDSVGEVIRYGEWLARFLELWYDSGDQRPDIRYLSSIMRLLLGRSSLVESVGLSLSTLVVIETNGELEAVDSLKTCYQGAAETGLNVFDHPFDAALAVPAISSRQMKAAALCDTCRACPFLDVCGGGYQPHRYSTARGFVNPTIYCESIKLLVGRTAQLMKASLDEAGVAVPPLVVALADAKLRIQGV